MKETPDLAKFLAAVYGSMFLFVIHGICFFTILRRLKSLGLPVKRVMNVSDAVAYYREFFKRAPKRGWSRAWIYCSIVSLAIAILWPAAVIVTNPKRSRGAVVTEH